MSGYCSKVLKVKIGRNKGIVMAEKFLPQPRREIEKQEKIMFFYANTAYVLVPIFYLAFNSFNIKKINICFTVFRVLFNQFFEINFPFVKGNIF